jgi:hypothetical protein
MANSAKKISLAGQILMAVWVAGWSAYMFLGPKVIPMMDIITSGVAIAAAFSPVYLSIWIDMFKKKSGNE